MLNIEVNGSKVDIHEMLEKATPKRLAKALVKQETVDCTFRCNSRDMLRLGKTGEYGWELLDDAPNWESIEDDRAEGILREMLIRYQKECM